MEGVRGQAGQDSAGRGMATPRASEDTDAEVGVTAREGHETEHALRPTEGQVTSMHSEEWRRVTDDDGWASEDTDMEVGIMECSNTREHSKRRNGGKCVMGSSKDQSTHSKGDVGERGEPTRGERGMKEGTTRHQDRRHGPSAIGMSGEWCLRKRRRVENGGPRTGKRKCSVPKDMQGRSGPEGVPRT
jgi:hypothetical protein